ncbi:hypothetical protein [Corticimicrobacter populi]|uniref:Uncharacterized protein n=1 Tax=Corticimicrobacter populi TaxID=2175229 RepID=A0A2V1JZT9_9BURK|nr:hypothetical protein [Corticimicrobacter populi]PWF22999.1 hypothetical protein DD235_08290 [Corticimicrobacter populi]
MTTPYLAAFAVLDQQRIEPCHFEPVDASSPDEACDAAAEIAAFVARPTEPKEPVSSRPETGAAVARITHDKSPFAEAAGL